MGTRYQRCCPKYNMKREKKGDVTGVTLPTITSENSIDGDKQTGHEFVK